MTATEPTVVDITDGQETELSIGEYLALWGGDPCYDKPPLRRGDGYTFYNYGSSGDSLDYLKDKLLPAVRRQLQCPSLSEHDKRQFETIRAFIEQKVADMEKGKPVPGVFKEEESFRNEMLVVITYGQVRQAMKGTPFRMTLRGGDYRAFAKAVNQGIDSRLQACFCPERGDRNDNGKVVLSVESLPILIRRLYEAEDEASNDLAASIMTSLGFRDNGQWAEPE